MSLLQLSFWKWLLHTVILLPSQQSWLCKGTMSSKGRNRNEESRQRADNRAREREREGEEERDEEKKQERERKERSLSRPLKIPSLLSSAESKMQLTRKKDAIDFSLLPSACALCLSLSFLLLVDSPGIALLSQFLLHSFGIQLLIYNPYFNSGCSSQSTVWSKAKPVYV